MCVCVCVRASLLCVWEKGDLRKQTVIITESPPNRKHTHTHIDKLATVKRWHHRPRWILCSETRVRHTLTHTPGHYWHIKDKVRQTVHQWVRRGETIQSLQLYVPFKKNPRLFSSAFSFFPSSAQHSYRSWCLLLINSVLRRGDTGMFSVQRGRKTSVQTGTGCISSPVKPPCVNQSLPSWRSHTSREHGLSYMDKSFIRLPPWTSNNPECK